MDELIYLYKKGNVPYDKKSKCQEFVFLTPYLSDNPSGGAILVCPGGAYNHLSNSTKNIKGFGQGVNNLGDQKEAGSIAFYYNKKGISVFVLNYRTEAVDLNINYKKILSDGIRAIRYIRYNASKYGINPNKIGVQGYSAGGHLASMLLTRYDFVIDDKNYIKDEIDLIDAKPNAAVLCYPVISLKDEYTHKTTRKNFINNKKLYDYYSADKAVTNKTSPTFLWCHKYDGSVNSINTKLMIDALKNNGVTFEGYIFDDNKTTDHGVGIAQNYDEAKIWPILATDFLKIQGF